MNAAHIDPASAGSFPGRLPPRGGAPGPPGGKELAKAHARGSTAVNETHNGPRHLMGSTLRAIRVFADTAFRVTVLGSESVRL